MNRRPQYPAPDHLSPEAALALFDCLTELVKAVWQHYESILFDQIIHDQNVPSYDKVES